MANDQLMDKKHKGALAEMQASAWLLLQGYEVFRNVSQSGPADLIAWIPGEVPFPVEVRRLHYQVSTDGKSCSAITGKAHHPDARILYACAETSACSFDLEALVGSLGYSLRPPASRTLICSVEGCGLKHDAKGLCSVHYNARYWRTRRAHSILLKRAQAIQSDPDLP